MKIIMDCFNNLILSNVDYLNNYSNLCNEYYNSKTVWYETLKYRKDKIENN